MTNPGFAIRLNTLARVGIIKLLFRVRERRVRQTENCMGPLGMGEIVVLFVLALLIFGPKKLPELGKTFGKGMAEFKRASNELKTTFQREMDNIEHETKDVKNLAKDVTKDINKDINKEINTSYYDDYEDDYYSDYDYGSSSTASNSSASGAVTKADGESASDSEPEPEAVSDASGESTPPESTVDSATPPKSSNGAVSGLPEAEAASASKSG